MVIQHWLLTFISQLNYFSVFVKINWPYKFRSISGLSVLFYWSVSTLCQHYAVCITVAFEEILKSNSVSLPPFPPQDYCAILGLCISIYIFESVYHFLFKMFAELWLRLCYIYSLARENWHLNSTESSNPHTWYIFPLILLVYNVCQQWFVVPSIYVVQVFC